MRSINSNILVGGDVFVFFILYRMVDYFEIVKQARKKNKSAIVIYLRHQIFSKSSNYKFKDNAKTKPNPEQKKTKGSETEICLF